MNDDDNHPQKLLIANIFRSCECCTWIGREERGGFLDQLSFFIGEHNLDEEDDEDDDDSDEDDVQGDENVDDEEADDNDDIGDYQRGGEKAVKS